MTKKIKLVLSGSGTRYPVFAGAIKRLIEEKYEITEVCGTSGGAIVAAALGAKYSHSRPESSINGLMKLLNESLPGPFLDPHFFPFGTRGIFKGNKILREFRRLFPESFSETRIPVNIVTFNMNKGIHKIWSDKDSNISLPLAVRASMSLPLIFDPVKINKDLHIDGGISANFPLDVFGDGKNVIGLRFNSSGNKKRTIKNKIDLINATVDGMMESSMREHMEDAHYAQTCFLKTKHGGLNLLMNKSDVTSQVKEGYNGMKNFLKDLRERRKYERY